MCVGFSQHYYFLYLTLMVKETNNWTALRSLSFADRFEQVAVPNVGEGFLICSC